MTVRALVLSAASITLLIAGCPQTHDVPRSQALPAVSPETQLTVVGDASDDDEELDRRRAAAWIELDSDNDGLPNDIELEFGLDLEDPSDGYDIDGDGVPNFRDDDGDGDNVPNDCDPDIDGDGVFNLLDIDIDGDAILDDVDFDMDGDGIRDEWDWDDDSDGNDDEEDDNESDTGSLEDEELRFSAAVQAITDKLAYAAELEDDGLRARAEQQFREDLRDLLAQVSKVKHEQRPIPLGGQEVKLIAKSLASRFKRGGSREMEFDIAGAITNLTPRHGPSDPNEPGTFTDPDATDAVDAVFTLLTEIQDVGRPDAKDDATQRLDALVSLKERLRQVPTPDCTDAVRNLVKMPGEATPEERVDGVIKVWDVLDEPTLDGVVGDLDLMTESLQSRAEGFAWDGMIDALTKLESMPGEGTLKEKFDGVMQLWDVMDDPELEDLVNGLEQVSNAIAGRVEGDWGWDVMIDALANAPGIENGIGSDQIDFTVDDVEEAEGA